MAVIRDLAIRAGFVRRVGLAVWLLATAIAGMPGLGFSHRLARRRVVAAMFDIAIRPVPVLSALSALTGAAAGFTLVLILGMVDIDKVLLTVADHIVTRNIVPLLVGVFVAGRSGVALAVRISDMSRSGEADALRLQCEDPAGYVLSPALLGFLSAALMLYLWALFIAHFSAALVLNGLHTATVARYRDLAMMTVRGDILHGLFRTLCFSLIAFWVAGYQGSRAAAETDGSEHAASQTFVYSLLALIAAQAAFSAFNA